jgi:hypothetical protein
MRAHIEVFWMGSGLGPVLQCTGPVAMRTLG